jgi:hypothetical protein
MNLTPYKPLLKIAKIDETANWCEEVQKLARRVFGVYVFDARRRVHCCEFVPSHELHLIESQPGYAETLEETDKVLDIINEGDSQSQKVIYIHCSQIENASNIMEGGFIPDEGVKIGVYKLYQGDYMLYQDNRDTQDKADAEYDAKVKEEWENLPNDEETEAMIAAWKEEGEKATAEEIEEILDNQVSFSF